MFKSIKIAYAMTGSFCTFTESIEQMRKLVELGADVIPIMSQNAYTTDTRFGNAEIFRNQIEEISGKGIIHTISDAEPIGPNKMADVLVVAPWWVSLLRALILLFMGLSPHYALI